jgi:hypothetical protein
MSRLKSDKERWLYILENKVCATKGENDPIIMLDNDDCCLDLPEIDCYIRFDYYLGWSDGVRYMLDAVGINNSPV